MLLSWSLDVNIGVVVTNLEVKLATAITDLKQKNNQMKHKSSEEIERSQKKIIAKLQAEYDSLIV